MYLKVYAVYANSLAHGSPLSLAMPDISISVLIIRSDELLHVKKKIMSGGIAAPVLHKCTGTEKKTLKKNLA